MRRGDTEVVRQGIKFLPPELDTNEGFTSDLVRRIDILRPLFDARPGTVFNARHHELTVALLGATEQPLRIRKTLLRSGQDFLCDLEFFLRIAGPIVQLTGGVSLDLSLVC